MRLLHFQHRNEWFVVNEQGQLLRSDTQKESFSDNWKFLGVSFHHWTTGIDTHFHKKVDANELIEGIVWDMDHGTLRQWRGRFCGRIPRIRAAYWENMED